MVKDTYKVVVIFGDVHFHEVDVHNIEVTRNGDLLLRHIEHPFPLFGFAKGHWDSYEAAPEEEETAMMNGHASDCAVNGPVGEEPAECDCGYQKQLDDEIPF